MDHLKRISEMEAALDECRAVLDNLEKSLDGLDAVKEKRGRCLRTTAAPNGTTTGNWSFRRM